MTDKRRMKTMSLNDANKNGEKRYRGAAAGIPIKSKATVNYQNIKTDK